MREKMEQIFDAMADMTLKRIELHKKSEHTSLDDEGLEMVRTTQSLYEILNYANHTVIPTASMPDVFCE